MRTMAITIVPPMNSIMLRSTTISDVPLSAGVPKDGHRRADREQEEEHVFPAEQDRQDEDDRGAEKHTGIGGHFRDALAGEKIENLIHGVPLSDDARLTLIR